MRKSTLVIIGILLISTLIYLISGSFLIYNKPIKSPYVLLEDWISPSVLEKASSYIVENDIDSVFIVGLKYTNTSASIQKINKTKKLRKNENNMYALYRGGIIGFEIPAEKFKESFTLRVKMHGTSCANIFPYYNVFFNKQFINSGFVNGQDKVYQFIISNKTIDSLAYILINFNNDITDSIQDRNLFISDIYIDTLDIDSIMLDNFFTSYSEMPNVNFVSQLNSIKYYIGDRGYDTSKVKFIEVNDFSFNKTLAYAKGAKKYFSKGEVKNINIITVYKHSSRSYLNFKNCLEKNIEVGCIPVNTIVEEKTPFLAGIDERISLLFSWIYWWFH